jgi:hypothetical protein
VGQHPLSSRTLAQRLSGVVVPILGASTLAAAMWAFSPRAATATVEQGTVADESALPVLAKSELFVIRGDIALHDAVEVLRWLGHVVDVFNAEAAQMGFTPAMPASPMTIIFFAERADFVRFARDVDRIDASAMGGYYATAPNHVVLYDDRSSPSFAFAIQAGTAQQRHAAAKQAAIETRRKIAHEAAHLLAFNTGVQRVGVDYPAWFTEGLAERVASRAMGEEPRSDAGSPWRTFATFLFATDAEERYAAAHSIFESLASVRPDAPARFESELRSRALDAFAASIESD